MTTTLARIILTVLLILPAARADEAERKAVACLVVEVPRWARENHCYSCHNNGDAARALVRARAVGLPVGGALADTMAWLGRPEGWEKNGGEGPASDKRLARLQFAMALAAAVEAGDGGLREPLGRAAERLAADQAGDGSWPIDDGGALGSPATYGRNLATAEAIAVLRRADPGRFRGRIARAAGWLERAEIANVPDAAASLRAGSRSREARAYLLRAQAPSGGWGPYPETPIEPFDTALALLALAPLRDDPAVAAAVARGRSALVGLQSDDGSWPATTRPPGGESYAQRLSTSGWATLALIASRP